MSQSITALRAGANPLLPIYPSSFDDVAKLARMAIMSGMIKPIKTGYGDDAKEEDPDATMARATMILLQGMELGIPPMQAVQLLAMINGRIVAHSEAVPGLLLSKGFKIKEKWLGKEMEDDWGVTVTVIRPDGQAFDGTFTVKKAKQAKLWSPDAKITKRGKNNTTYQADNDSAWHRFPDRMLHARALGFAAKDGAADALKGLMVREEMEDLIRSEQARDITPTKQIATVLDFPDDDVNQDAQPAAQAAAPAPEADADDMLADPDGVLAKIEDDLALCDSVEEVSQVEGQYEDWFPRLPKEHRRKAKALFSKARE